MDSMCRRTSGGGFEIEQILGFHENGRKGLADFIVQFARQCAALLFLRADQSGGKLLQTGLRVHAFFKPALHFAFQPQDVEDGEAGQSRAAEQRDSDHGAEPELESSEDSAQFFVAAPQRFLVERLDAVGDLEHGSAARDQLLVEERIAVFVALFGRPGEGAIQNIPIGVDLTSQVLKGRALVGLERLRIGIERRADILAQVIERSQLSARAGGFGSEERVADEGAGQVDVGADLFEGAIAGEEARLKLGIVLAQRVE